MEYRQAISAGVQRAPVEALEIPDADKFQVIQEHDEQALVFDRDYLGIKRTAGIVFVQITMSFGRKPGQKRKLYRRIAELLQENPGVRPEDVLVNLVEVAWENWSFGNGEAQYTL